MRLMCTLVSHPSKKVNKRKWLESAHRALRNVETIRAVLKEAEFKRKWSQECCAMKLVLDTRLAYIKRILFFMKQQSRFKDWLDSLGLSSVEGHASNDELEACVRKLYRFQDTMHSTLSIPCKTNGPDAKVHAHVLEELRGCVKEFEEMRLSLDALQDEDTDEDTDLDVESHHELRCGQVCDTSSRQHVLMSWYSYILCDNV